MKNKERRNLIVTLITLVVSVGLLMYGLATGSLDDEPSNVGLGFSVPGGLYMQPFELSISLDRNVRDVYIYYTLDGSEPIPGRSGTFLHDEPRIINDRTPERNDLSAIPANDLGCFIVYRDDDFTPPQEPVIKATVVRAQAFNRHMEPVSDIYTHSYFVRGDIFERYADLPIVSLVTRRDNFFDDEIGVYARGHGGWGGYDYGQPLPNWEMRGIDWERPVHVEIFEHGQYGGGTEHFERVVAQAMGIRIHGGGTRRMAQKSLRLYPREVYDYANPSIVHDIFQGDAVDISGHPIHQFNRVILRNFGNEGTGTMFRCAGLAHLARNMNVEYQASRPTVVFLNGEFWGMYNFRERMCERYISAHYSVRPRSVAIMEQSGGMGLTLVAGHDGDWHDWVTLMDFFSNNSFYSNENYEYVQQYFDIKSFIDYYILQIYFGNIDWPGNNARWWRYTGNIDPNMPGRDGRWRWMMFDLDSTANFGFAFNHYDDTLYRVLYWPGERSEMRNDGFAQGEHTQMFRRLMQNSDFREKFVNRFCEVMNSYFSEEAFDEMIDKFSERIRPVVPEQIERWGRINSVHDWERELRRLQDFGQHRQEYMQLFIQRNLDVTCNCHNGRRA